MKKLLIIGYLHPHARPGGSFRTLPLLRNLPGFGWEPTIVTPRLLSPLESGLNIVETAYGDSLGIWGRLFGISPEKDARQQVQQRLGGTEHRFSDFLLACAGEIINYPDAHKGWFEPALEACRALLKTEPADAILSCHPTISHLVAGRLHAEFGIPWVADFPDLWSQNHNYHYSPVRRRRDRRLEKKTLAAASTLVTVSEPWAAKLTMLHGNIPVHAIPNGFDPAEINQPPAPLTSKLTITYTGKIYPGRQNAGALLRALAEMGRAHPEVLADFEVRFFGEKLPWLDELAARLGLAGVVKQYGPAPRAEVLARQRESQLLLLLDWDDPAETGVYPGKLFEYLAARRPVLATGGVSGNVVDALLTKTGAGWHAISVEEITNTLRAIHAEYKEKGRLAFGGREAEINRYSHTEMTRRFAEILDNLL